MARIDKRHHHQDELGVAGYRVDALVSALAVLSPKTAKALSQLRIPVVCFNGRIHVEWVSSVSLDNLRSGAAVADRQSGFLRRLRNLRRAAPLVLPGDFSYESGFAAAASLIKSHPRPDAVACANDLMALGLLDGIRRAGLRSPEDILVVGYDNIGMAEWASYELSSFDQDVPEMIRRGLRLILDDRAADDAHKGVLETVPARLVVRRTTADPGLAR